MRPEQHTTKFITISTTKKKATTTQSVTGPRLNGTRRRYGKLQASSLKRKQFNATREEVKTRHAKEGGHAMAESTTKTLVYLKWRRFNRDVQNIVK